MVMATEELEQAPVEIRESGLRAMHSRHPEILLEGPAGTGKSFFAVWWIHQLCELFPGSRFYFVRQTRKSLNNSAMSLYEDLLGWGHPVTSPARSRAGRESYDYPYAERLVDTGDGRGPWPYKGQSKIYLLGMDNPERLMSTEGDGAVFFEGTEGTVHGWDLLGSRMRRGHLPWNFRILDCNPGPATHWVNLRADEKLEIPEDVRLQLGDRYVEMSKMHRVCTTLRDNPKYWDAVKGEWTELGLSYKIKLAGLSPVNKKRLEDGEWVSAAGQVYANFLSSKHVVAGKLERRGMHWWLMPRVNKKLGITAQFKARRIAYFGISNDYGFYPDPGVLQLWAMDDEDHAFLVKEHYETNVSRQVWAKRAADWQAEYDVRAIVCEHDEEQMKVINEMIGHKLWGGLPIAQKAVKAIIPGIDVTRWGFEDDEGMPDDDGEPTRAPEPRIRIFDDALEHEDMLLREELRPTCTVQEVGAYVYPPRVDGKIYQTDKPDDRCDEHGCDAMRYWCMYSWRSKHRAKEEPVGYKRGTMGHQFQHARRFKEGALNSQRRHRR